MRRIQREGGERGSGQGGGWLTGRTLVRLSRVICSDIWSHGGKCIYISTSLTVCHRSKALVVGPVVLFQY
jgi:hypothetical protein